jgi:hypothetical protein
MPKIKEKTKPKEFDSEEKETEKVIDPDLLLDDEGVPVVEEVSEEEEEEESEVLDDDEVDPFKDKWEE